MTALDNDRALDDDRAPDDSRTHEDIAALVVQAKHDREAFGALYAIYVRRIYNYVYYRTGNHQDAEDLTAQVFHRALGHIENYDERGVPFSAWLYRIAHNLVANWHRDRSRRNIVPLDEFVPSSHPAEAPEAAAERLGDEEMLLEALRRLPEDRQQLLILKFVDRLSNAEIGEIMGRTEGAVKSLYHRTLAALREELGAHAPEGALEEQPEKKPARRWLRRR
ncbi:MAG: sigma-70 family RNA polymerase sigma factor [Anaerolineae bacterium]|nr:sigma-70 family RNA polymerase sigma factor [Anaerolineae bacterium]